MKKTLLLTLLFSVGLLQAQDQSYSGFFNFEWKDSTGKILLEVDKLDQEFLYVNALAAGVGSNDIGLDRGQLGNERIVKFIKSGNKVLLVQPNYSYRAESDNPSERRAIEEAFAQSVLWGFKVESQKEGKLMIDLTPMLLSDAHNVADRLKSSKQGSYKIDASRSAVYLPRTKSFPKNSEFEAMITFTGKAEGGYIRSVTPSSEAVTVRMHHSFIELPDDNYEPRKFHPFSGFNVLTYADYAVPIYESKEKKYIYRHRLEKKNPGADKSEAVEPIVYYLDPGTPEPIRSALLDGARWWNQAFEEAGYIDAFQVKMLPDDADPLDVRYNVIQWVHRSTRGWSYGASVSDPRTGEIIKGHVSLGSLRVRQDFLIAQGLLSPYGSDDGNHSPMMELALARLRQLSAHEVGHTIGLAHNFAASYNDRASVMDYPHPVVSIGENGEMDLSDSYAVGIGDWDKRTILYGYQDFSEEINEENALNEIIKESIDEGFLFISDSDARPAGGAHPYGHLWDNGDSPIDELSRLSMLRSKAMQNFGQASITTGTPYSYLENVLVPLYLAHRYQVEAVAKLIGGVNYTYAVKGDAQSIINEMVDPAIQKEAMETLLSTLEPSFLEIPERILEKLPPPAFGYRRNRETFDRYTSTTFDPIAAAEGSANHTLAFMLNEDRLTRIVHHHARNADQISLSGYLESLSNSIFNMSAANGVQEQIANTVQRLYVMHLLQHARNTGGFGQVTAEALVALEKVNTRNLDVNSANGKLIRKMIDDGLDLSKELKLPSMPDMPPGSPIGCD
ncbi:zinc-dependent metalloprotease [Portibacter marinus]|uniref:zinc-dependent metalloprotease n=1 Tax=Portibacter marinus TaxID=2898660 RepID=UPI001F3C2964|nr:zinc-dependent metalloprotease [Portibacter marinus]